jgi:hypothetical protein
MKSTLKELLIKLSMIDPTLPDFLIISKELAETVRVIEKKKADKPKEPKAPKSKPKKTIICEDCAELLNNRIKDILP